MKCIIGLGNPGNKYKETRHNIGFMVIDELVNKNEWDMTSQRKLKADSALEHLHSEKVLLLKPQTYMNLSGESVRAAVDFYQLDPSDLLVIYDDLDLPAGKIRLREKGGHGGHNGIRSIIDHLGTKEFKRLRIGIGRPTNSMPIVNYVLEPFSTEQEENVKISVKEAVEACEAWMSMTFNEVMNKFNQ